MLGLSVFLCKQKTAYEQHISDCSSDVCSSDLHKATGGFRYTWDKQENDSTRITNLFPVDPSQGTAPISICTDAATTPDGCQLGLAKKAKAPTWLIDLDYKPVTDVLLFAK